mgnify:FL=1
MSKEDNGGFTTGLLIGGIIGTVIGILIAPKSGSETRSELIEKSEYWKERAEQLSDTVRGKVTPTIENISEKLAPTIESAREQMTPLIEQVNARFTPEDDSDDKEENKAPEA